MSSAVATGSAGLGETYYASAPSILVGCCLVEGMRAQQASEPCGDALVLHLVWDVCDLAALAMRPDGSSAPDRGHLSIRTADSACPTRQSLPLRRNRIAHWSHGGCWNPFSMVCLWSSGTINAAVLECGEDDLAGGSFCQSPGGAYLVSDSNCGFQ